MHTNGKSLIRGGAALIAALLFSLLAVQVRPGLALAHAALKSSTPAAGSTVNAGLTQIVLNFTEETSIDQSLGEVDGPGGTAVAGASMAVDRTERTKMVITTPALTAGTYTVKWKSVTEDDNGIENGTFTFTVAGNSAAETPTVTTTQTGGQGGTGTTTTSTGSLPVAGAPETPGLLITVGLMALGLLVSGAVMVQRATRKI